MKKLIIPLSLLALLTACDNKEKQKEQPQPQIETEATSPSIDEPVEGDVRIWSSVETNLPRGLIIGGEMNTNDNTINSLQIQDTITKVITLVRDIDPYLWNAIKSGDIIK